MQRKNFRIEQETETQQFAMPTGGTLEVEFITSECSAYERPCTSCGQDFTVRGVIGGLRELFTGGLCPGCTAEQDPDFDDLLEEADDEFAVGEPPDDPEFDSEGDTDPDWLSELILEQQS